MPAMGRWPALGVQPREMSRDHARHPAWGRRCPPIACAGQGARRPSHSEHWRPPRDGGGPCCSLPPTIRNHRFSS
jgi:hypothetical protein